MLNEGELEAGQDIVKISDEPEQVSVAEIDALLYLPGHPRDNLERALRIPALSPGWKDSLQSLLEQSDTPTTFAGNSGLTGVTIRPPAWQGFRPMRVVATQTESRNVRSVMLSDPDGTPLPEWVAGQSIALRVPTAGDTTVVRNYSLCNSPTAHVYRTAVKRETHGAASTYIHDYLQVGALTDVAAPRGAFVLDDGSRPLVLLSAGVGVTPVLSILHALADTRSDRPVWWLHCARSGAEHSFAGEARQLLRRLPGSRTEIFYSQPMRADRIEFDYSRSGRVTADTLEELQLPRDAAAFLCGPVSFMDEVTDALAAYGLHRRNIHTETFGARAGITPGIAAAPATPPHEPKAPAGGDPIVQFARSGISAPWSPSYGSLLEFAEACDIPTQWSCRTGVCHTCETGLLAGQVIDDPEPLEPPASGNCLLCIATPSELIVLDL